MCYNNPEPAAKKERTGTFLFEDTGGNKMEEINYQQKFEELFCTHIKREGAQQEVLAFYPCLRYSEYTNILWDHILIILI